MVVHKRLMLSRNCGAIDLAVGCSGYPYALSIAKGLIESSGFKNILIINSSTLTKIIHQKDKASRFIFGDGAAATLVSWRDNNWGIGEFIFESVSKMTDAIIIKDGGARNPIDTSSYIDYKDDYGNITNNTHLYMDGPSVFNFGLKAVPQMINDLLTKSKTKLENIDLFIFHQANLYLIESIRKKLFIPEEKVFNFIETVGNTVSATIPIAIYEAQKSGKIKPGSKVLLAGFGVGLSTGATIIHF
jgi:3-oxoacyl-[acyl-carrier-protein] synthase-3